MTIKSKMLLIILVGIGILFAANLYSSLQMNSAHGQYSSDESLTAHSSAWFSNMDTQFVSNLLAYDPMDGSERNANFWDPELDPFEESDGENPLFTAILEKDAETAEGLFEQVFSDAIISECPCISEKCPHSSRLGWGRWVTQSSNQSSTTTANQRS